MNILDASAYLALIYHENGYQKIDALIARSKEEKATLFMHRVNFMEVVYKAKKRLSARQLKQMLSEFNSPWW